MRKHFIDNVRWITVLFLFPYHTTRIFDGVHGFYIKGPESAMATFFVLSCTPWFMPLLFAVAGVSAHYALEKRGCGAFVGERVRKLLIPLLFGLTLLVPIQTYFAERFHNAYTGTYWGQYRLFFTKVTDFSGYSGGFTPGQLWFVFYLFVVSLAALPLILLLRKRAVRWQWANGWVIPLCLITWLLSYVWDAGGKGLGEAFSLFFLGYFVLAEEAVQEFIARHRISLSISGGVLTICTVVFQTSLRAGVADRGIMALTGWICILAILGAARHGLDRQNEWTARLSASSFSFYLFHQSWIVLIGFYVLQCRIPAGLQYILILSGAFLGCIGTYAVCRRFRVLQVMFAVRGGPAAQRKSGA